MNLDNHYAIHSMRISDLLLNINRLFKFRGYKPKLYIDIQRGHYQLKTATSFRDLYQCFRLRYQCFKAADQKIYSPLALDIDEYDLYCDHLVIKDTRSNKVVGTYRVLEEGVTDKFYSESEFIIDDFLKAPGKKIEVGRACIAKDNRNSKTIQLLWNGLKIYFRKRNIRYLFGCSSVKATDAAIVKKLINELSEKNSTSSNYHVAPRPEFISPGYDQVQPREYSGKILPTLLKSYLKAGAHVHGIPAYDKDFACFDLFTILDLTQADLNYINLISGSKT